MQATYSEQITEIVAIGLWEGFALIQIFLSYAREDQEEVEKLYQRLWEAKFKPWMDEKDIRGGEQ